MYSLAGVLFAISAFHAWRYCRISIDPDWAYFNLWGFTGSVYGRDFADCKTPFIHLWYLGLSKLVGKNVARVKFIHHFLLGSVGVILLFLTGDFWAALSYTVLVNSGWLLSFHGNVGQLAAAFGVLGMATGSPLWWALAVAVEPKLVFSFAVLYPVHAALLGVVGGLAFLGFHNQKWFRLIWESSVTIPVRMTKNRKGDFYKAFVPWFTSNGMLYLLPWTLFGVLAHPDLWYWLPALAYVVFIATGKIVRQNHLIPFIPFVVFSGLEYVWLLAVVDFVSAGLYFGNIWARFYAALDDVNAEAEKVGLWLRGKPGTVYVNGIHSGIYIHASKPVQFGFAEQIEIREVAHERRAEMIERWRQAPPDWVVDGKIQGITFKPIGYQRALVLGENMVYKKIGG